LVIIAFHPILVGIVFRSNHGKHHQDFPNGLSPSSDTRPWKTEAVKYEGKLSKGEQGRNLGSEVDSYPKWCHQTGLPGKSQQSF
jgi:hypothetical protein